MTPFVLPMHMGSRDDDVMVTARASFHMHFSEIGFELAAPVQLSFCLGFRV